MLVARLWLHMCGCNARGVLTATQDSLKLSRRVSTSHCVQAPMSHIRQVSGGGWPLALL